MSGITIDEIIEFLNTSDCYCEIAGDYREAILKILKQSKLRIYTQDTIDALRRDRDILQQQSDIFYNEKKKLEIRDRALWLSCAGRHPDRKICEDIMLHFINQAEKEIETLKATPKRSLKKEVKTDADIEVLLSDKTS